MTGQRLRDILANLRLLAVMAGLGTLQFGWIIWPPLGRLAAIANAAFVLALLIGWLIRRAWRLRSFVRLGS
jgi:hypothetical protein